MRNSAKVLQFRGTKPQVVTPYERPAMRVTKDAFNLDPVYVRQIEDHCQLTAKRVIENFIVDPVLLPNFYVLLGMLPKEIQDIQRHVQDENVHMALIETDDLIEKLLTWRHKLSHKLTV